MVLKIINLIKIKTKIFTVYYMREKAVSVIFAYVFLPKCYGIFNLKDDCLRSINDNILGNKESIHSKICISE